MMIITTLRCAIREARGANRRAWKHAIAQGANDVGGRLYRQHERAERAAAMAWARRYQLAAKKAAGCSDRQLTATINSTAKQGALSVELRAFRAEANRRRSTLRAAA